MCYYVTAALLDTVDPKILQSVFETAGRTLGPLDQSPVQSALPSGYRLYHTCASHCDCGTPLGSRGPKRESEAGSEDKMRARLRRKGWSEAKIERWARDRASSGQSMGARAGNPLGAEEWTALIRSVVHQHRAGPFGLLLHWYTGEVATESFPVQRTEHVSLSDLPEALLSMEEDVLYLFQLSHGSSPPIEIDG